MRVASRYSSVLVLLFLATSGSVFAQAAPSSAESAPTNKQLASAKCISGMEKFLPGEYFYCLAAQSYGQSQPRYAEKFFKEAASWGSKPADYVLGVMTLNGDGQPVNPPLALAWFALAAERHTPRFQQPYDELKGKLGARDIAKSNEYLASLERTYGDEVAAARAEARYRDGVKRLRASASVGTFCMEGVRDYRTATDASPTEGGPGASSAQGCGTIEQVAGFVDTQASDLFEDWSGHVVVGPVQPVADPGRAAR